LPSWNRSTEFARDTAGTKPEIKCESLERTATALKLAPGMTLPPQHSGVAALPPAVVAAAIDCTDIEQPALDLDLSTITSEPEDLPANSKESEEIGKSHGGVVPNIRSLSSVKACEVAWLWQPYLPSGRLVILSGDPDMAKTWIALSIATALTLGRTPYTNEPRPPANVLYLTVENTAEELRGRFSLLGGNLDFLHITDDSVKLSDISYLEKAIKQTKAQLIVFDPIQSFLGANVDTYRANKIRPVLDALALLAKKHGCCVLLLRHLTKAGTGRGIYRGSGGIDLSAAARSELLAGHAANNPAQFALVHTKSNLGQKGVSLGYAIGPDGFGWTGESKLTDHDLLAPESHRAAGGAIIEAKQFLLSMLAAGPRLANEMHAEAKQAGIKPATLHRAKGELGVKSDKIGLSDGWMWLLPESDHVSHTQKP
jgi:hypothetical protein